MDKVEGSIADLEEAITTIRLNQDQIRLDQEQRFSRLENMIAALARGKSKSEMEGTSTPSSPPHHQGDTLVTKSNARALLLEDVSTITKKVEMPSFDGADPVGWVARTEQYFEIHGIQNELKVSLALVSMEGAPLHWLRWLRQRNPHLTWEQLREELMQRASRVPDISDRQCLGFFLNGLREDIRLRLRSHETTDLYRTMKLAREIERQRWHSSKDKAARNFSDGMKMKYPSHGLGPKARISQDQRPYFGPSSDQKRDGPLTKPPDKKPIALPAPPAKSSTTQLKQRGTRHKSLRALIGGEDEYLTEEGELVEMEEIRGSRMVTELDEAHFSRLELPLFSVGGIQRPRTMKFQGWIANQPVVVLVDSGASHNFISNQLVQRLQLPVSATPSFNVKLGDGCKVSSTGLCKQLELQLLDYTVNTDCYVFPLGGVDFILGVAWLETLGEIHANWRQMTLKFQMGNRTVILQGDPSLSRTPVSLRALRKTVDVEFSAFVARGI
ncbi:hypothetical protein GH714_018224 [Hevea brasiliensis]|uniref:Retrotransposon gag domain-containing protein n=1 Tax=Hevea brasiliensis TaxID=3981 RepID=A0A6A6MLG8_HEVBR|nr:hypothetical protein GH714_018224 [Hevea brasiliensis]